MSRRTRKLSPRTEAIYARVLKRAYPNSVPDHVPNLENPPWPESVRLQLCAAIRYYWEQRDPAKGVTIIDKIPPGEHVEHQRLFPALAEVDRFTAAAQLSPHAPVLRVMLGLGPRAEEILTLPRAEAEGALQTQRLVFDGKGNKRRELPVDKAQSALRALLAARPKGGTRWQTPGDLFGFAGNAANTRHNLLAREIHDVAKAAGLPPAAWTPHKLRHIFATRMTRAGAPEALVAYALGHARRTVTQVYIHVTPDQLLPFMTEA